MDENAELREGVQLGVKRARMHWEREAEVERVEFERSLVAQRELLERTRLLWERQAESERE